MSTADAMKVDVLTGDDVVVVAPTTVLAEVAVTLVTADIGAVVVGTTQEPVGIISERDIVRAVADGKDLSTVEAGTVASKPLVWADAETAVADVAEEMAENWVRHVLIERDGKLIGIVSARDLLGVYASAGSESER